MARRTEEVQRDIEQTRAELGNTLEAIGDKVAPKKAVRRAKWKAADKVEDVKDRVSPARLARRGTDNVLHRLHDVRLSIMGSDDEGDDEVTYTNGSTRSRTSRTRALEEGVADARDRVSDATERAGDAASTVVEKAKAAPGTVARSAKGNPLVAGLVVFGGGYLVASRLRPTDRERTLAERAKERLEPVKQQAIEAGRSMADEIKGVAEGGIGSTVGAGAVRAVRSELRQRAADAAETVKEKATEVKEKATSSADTAEAKAADAGKTAKRTTRAASKKVKGAAKDAAGTTGKATTRRRTGTTRPAGTTAAASRRRSPAKAG